MSMKKSVLIWCLFLCIIACNTGQLKKGQVDLSKVPAPVSHYQEEYTFDKPTDTILWAGQNSGLNVAFGSTDELNMVRYVISNFPYSGKSTDCYGGDLDSAYLMPDRFESFERFDLPGRTVRPIWLSFDIPVDAEPGVYDGTIEVYSEGHSSVLNIKIKIQNM